MERLSHVDDEGRVRMVDVGGKPPMLRIARASGRIDLAPSTLELIKAARMKKGDVLAVAEIAGIQAAKRTSELIPLCHPLKIDMVDVRLELLDDDISAMCEVRSTGRTGVEMEALTGVSVALLTVYDMAKAVDKEMRIRDIILEEKIKLDAGKA